MCVLLKHQKVIIRRPLVFMGMTVHPTKEVLEVCVTQLALRIVANSVIRHERLQFTKLK